MLLAAFILDLFVSDINHLDTQLLEGYLESLGQDIVQQMLDLYIQQSGVYLSDINSAIDQESQSKWQEHCHKMKGATASVGLLVLHSMLVKLEKSEADWSDKVVQIDDLSKVNHVAITAFNNWLNS